MPTKNPPGGSLMAGNGMSIQKQEVEMLIQLHHQWIEKGETIKTEMQA